MSKLNIGEDVEEMLRSDLAPRLDGAKNLREQLVMPIAFASASAAI